MKNTNMKSLRELAAILQEIVDGNSKLADLPVRQITNIAGGSLPVIGFDFYVRKTERTDFPNQVVFDTILQKEKHNL